MKCRCVLMAAFVASSLLACGGTVDGGDEELPPSSAGRSTSSAGASGTATGGSAGSDGLSLETPASSGGSPSNAGTSGSFAATLPMREPSLPGVDFDDGSWIKLGPPTWSGSGGAVPQVEGSGGSSSGGSPAIPK